MLIEIFPTPGGKEETNLDFGELKAGEAYAFEINIKNTSKFNLTDMEAESKHVLMKILDSPKSINAGETKKLNLVISVPENIMQAIKPDLAISGTFVLR